MSFPMEKLIGASLALGGTASSRLCRWQIPARTCGPASALARYAAGALLVPR